MTVTEVRSPERPTAGDAALVASLKRPRYEIFPLDGVEDEVARHIPAEVKLTLTASPSKGMEPTLKLAERLPPPLNDSDQNGDLLSAGAARGVRGAGKPSVISTDRMRSSKSVLRSDV